MAENNQHFNIQELADKWAQGKLTPDEQAYLERWYADFNDEHIKLTDSRHDNAEALRNAMLARINSRIEQGDKPVRSIWNWPRIAAAASILLILSAGSYFLLRKQRPAQTAQNQQSDIGPGGNKAVLTLANGSKIDLTGAKKGTIALQANTIIKKTSDGKIEYASAAKSDNSSSEIQYNTMTTQRGGRYEGVLTDGTQFVLDAASSIRYPVNFNGDKRLVQITGQVWIKPKHNAARPFYTTAKGITLKDIGTEFNINAYDDEPGVATTLVEGSVSITPDATHQAVLLKPGQQATLKNNAIIVKAVDVDDIIAWKNGQTSFKTGDIQEIMRQVSRWYDVDVEYQGDIPEMSFTGGVSRNSKLSSVLKVLALNGIHFSVEGRKIIVKP